MYNVPTYLTLDPVTRYVQRLLYRSVNRVQGSNLGEYWRTRRTQIRDFAGITFLIFQILIGGIPVFHRSTPRLRFLFSWVISESLTSYGISYIRCPEHYASTNSLLIITLVSVQCFVSQCSRYAIAISALARWTFAWGPRPATGFP